MKDWTKDEFDLVISALQNQHAAFKRDIGSSVRGRARMQAVENVIDKIMKTQPAVVKPPMAKAAVAAPAPVAPFTPREDEFDQNIHKRGRRS